MRITMKILALAVIVSAAACKKTNDAQPSQNSSGNNSLMTGQVWKVGYFGDNGKDETYKFNGYTIQFLENKVVTINAPGGSFEGTWNIANDSGLNRFYLSASGNYPMTEINDDWLIVETSSTLIWLGDDNPDKTKTLKFVSQ